MSENLGPIHYMMYEKIKFQDRITSYLLSGNEKLMDLDEKMPPVSTKDLADLVDTDNIHGWLASRIDVVEARLSYALRESEDTEEKLYKLGKEMSEGVHVSSPEELFQYLNQYLLDGMPCDHALTAQKDENGDLFLIQNVDVHERYQTHPLMTDPSLSLDKTCEGHHEEKGHEHHESFDLQVGAIVSETNEKATRYHKYRYYLLKGLLENLGYYVDRINAIDYKIYQLS